MRGERPDFETLNAYVDGELGDARAAAVARAVAADPAVARQVALIAELRSAVAAAVETPELDLPGKPAPGRPARRRRPRWPALALAAGVAAFVIAAGALHLAGGSAGGGDWTHAAWSLHRAWAAPPAAGELVRDARAGMLPAAVSAPLANAYVPDLSAARLTIAYVSFKQRLRRAPALVVGYAGSRGCRITLVATPADVAAGADLQAFAAGPGQGYAWRAGGLSYLVLNQGMDRARFDLLAETVHRTSFERLPIDQRRRTALAASRRTSVPCAA